MMDMHARKEYRGVVRERYWKARSKKEKSQILDEYCGNTGHARKYAIRKLRARENPDQKPKKRRKPVYDGEVTAALAKVWSFLWKDSTIPVARGSSPLSKRRLIDCGRLENSPYQTRWLASSRLHSHNSIICNRQDAGNFHVVTVKPYLDTQHIKRHALGLKVQGSQLLPHELNKLL